MIFNQVEDVMANILSVFSGGISLLDMSMMSIEELQDWHERAKVRNEGS
jgi:hypothetical protein